jgi:diguanylate cyclase (GGDEF)-like protein
MAKSSFSSFFPRIERLYSATRLAVLSGILTWAVFHDPSSSDRLGVAILFAVVALQVGHFYFHTVKLRKSYEDFFVGSLIFDVAFTTALIYFTGCVDSSFYLFYYLTIAVGAYYLGLQRGLILSLVVTTLYSLLVYQTTVEIPMVSFLMRLFLAWSLAAGVGVIANQTKQSESKLLKLLDTLNVQTTELERTQAQIENIYDTSRKLGGILNLDQLLDEITKIADSLWGYALFEVILISPKTGGLELVAAVRDGERRILDIPEPVRLDGVISRVIQNGVPDRIVDTKSCQYYVQRLEGARSELAVPMLSHGRVIGVINAESESAGRFTERDQKLVSILAASASMAVENARLHKQVSDLAVIDELTGINNFRYFSERLVEEKRRSERYNLPLSLIMIDIDWFKRTNDTYGHEIGNIVLRELVEVMKECTRDTDHTCRYGGEEFIVILPQTGAKDAEVIAERIRNRVDRHEFGGYGGAPKLHMTVSVGITSYPDNGLSSDELISAVDSALYRAKGAGKNVVCSV